MTEARTPSATPVATTAHNRGVKQGLPSNGLAAAEDAASKLWAVARLGTASPEAFAKQWGATRKPSGSGWDTRMALLRGFGLVRVEDNKQIGLSDLGHQLVNPSDPAAQIQARRAAVLSLKAYRELVDSFDGFEVPEHQTLANKLQFEYGKTEDFARRAATAFVDSLRHAEMLDSDQTLRKGGVSPTPLTKPPTPPAALLEPAGANEDDERAADIDAAFDEGVVSEADLDADESPADPVGQTQQPLAAGAVSLALTLDLSSFRADEVIQILRALGLSAHG